MNRLVGFALLAPLLTCAGCFTAALPDSLAPKQPAPVSKALPPVTPAQITNTNGQEVLQALDDELTREEQQSLNGNNHR